MSAATVVRLLVFAIATIAYGCSATYVDTSSASFTGPALTTATSDDGMIHVALRASPSPPTRGLGAFELTITDANGKTLDGLNLAVVAWMPAHGHGASTTPTVAERGDGRYVVSNVQLYMPGTWELRVRVSGGALRVAENVAPSFEVE